MRTRARPSAFVVAAFALGASARGQPLPSPLRQPPGQLVSRPVPIPVLIGWSLAQPPVLGRA